MAYLREEKETLEIDYPLENIWAAIPKAIRALNWKIQEKDDDTHKLKIKTKSGFLSYSSIIQVEIVFVDDKTTRMNLNAETPVTTITAMADFGRTKDRVELFVGAIAKQLEKGKKKKTSNAPKSSET